jgi:hypothetical protein
MYGKSLVLIMIGHGLLTPFQAWGSMLTSDIISELI